MGYHRRVTLRCLCEDLTVGWADVAQQRKYVELRAALQTAIKDSEVAAFLELLPSTARASHPLIQSFHSAFESSNREVQRENISGLTDPHWWKQKVARWRGAATDAEIVGPGEVWLCAGGMRAAGDSRDFYTNFTTSVIAHGPIPFLPSHEDRRLQAVEEKTARRDAWSEQVRLSVMVCLARCAESGKPQTLHVSPPAPEPTSEILMHMTIDLVRVEEPEDEIIELFLTVSEQDHSRPGLLSTALDAARTVLEPVADTWRVLPGLGTDQVWSVLVSPETTENAARCVQEERLLPRLSGSVLRLGVQAHYTRKNGIVHAVVNGDSVRALCGTWFVPTATPDDLPVCPMCRSTYDELPTDDSQPRDT